LLWREKGLDHDGSAMVWGCRDRHGADGGGDYE
jgi:hypothetical protein